MTIKKVLALLFVVSFLGIGAFAQNSDTHQVTMTVPAIALLDLDDDTLVTLAVTADAAGLPPLGADSTADPRYLNYTTLNDGVTLQRITVEWDAADSAPPGTTLSVEATAVTALCGTAGAAVLFVDFDGTAQDLVTAIPSCATGVGATFGAELTYTLDVVTPGDLVVDLVGTTVDIIFTLIDM